MAKEIKFTVICLNSTPTVKKGKEYDVLDESPNSISIINDNGVKIRLRRERFGELIYKNEIDKSATYLFCNDSGKFRSITKGKSYKLVKESKDLYYVINNLNKEARYGKKYFSKVVEKVEKPKVLKAICIFTLKYELTFMDSYDFVDKPDDMIEVTNDRGTKSSYLKKRFKFEMQ